MAPSGLARTSGLYLDIFADDPAQWGVCKPPVAAGQGSGGRKVDIFPGRPDESILVYRMECTEPGEAMPELGRQTVHDDAQALSANGSKPNPARATSSSKPVRG